LAKLSWPRDTIIYIPDLRDQKISDLFGVRFFFQPILFKKLSKNVPVLLSRYVAKIGHAMSQKLVTLPVPRNV